MKYFYNKYISGKIANDIQKVDEKIGTLSQLTTEAKTNIVSAINSVKTELKNVITKSMLSNQQVNDTGKVPTSALAYSMQQSITKLNSDLSKSLTIPPINSVVARENIGGWKKIGNLVFVDVRFKLVNKYQHAAIMHNFPVPKNDATVLTGYNETASRTAIGQVKSNGNLEWHDSGASNTGDACTITGVYICK